MIETLFILEEKFIFLKIKNNDIKELLKLCELVLTNIMKIEKLTSVIFQYYRVFVYVINYNYLKHCI